MGASLGLSGDGSAEAAPGMAAILASRGPVGPILAFQLALRVILASWFPIQVELMDTPGRDKCVLDPTPKDCDTAGAALDRNSGTADRVHARHCPAPHCKPWDNPRNSNLGY